MGKIAWTLVTLVLLSSCERPKKGSYQDHLHRRGPRTGNFNHKDPVREKSEEDCGKWTVAADFIYWRADEDGLEYVTKKDRRGSIHKPKIAWDPGFKVGLGYTFADFWGLFFKWTFFHTDQSGHKRGHLFPWWIPGKSVKKASAHWDLHYQTYDLDVVRDYCVQPKLVVRPHMGLRGALIDQDYKVRYDRKRFKADNDFGGIGVRLGSELRWMIVRHFELKGDLSGSFLYGHFDVHEKRPHLHQELSRVAPNLEAYLGFQWETLFSRDRYRVAVSLGYEFSEWFSQNQMTRIFNSHGKKDFEKVHGDLGLQGATLEVLFDF